MNCDYQIDFPSKLFLPINGIKKSKGARKCLYLFFKIIMAVGKKIIFRKTNLIFLFQRGLL